VDAEASARGGGEDAVGNPGARVASGELSPRLLRAVMASARSVIVGMCADGSWFPISPAFTTLLGYPPDGPGGRLIDLVHPADRAAATALFGAARLSPALTPPVDLRLRAESGRWLVLETVASGRLDDPEIGAVLFYGRDVTAQRQTERALRTAQRDLQEHNEALTELGRLKNEFVAGVSHELRSPLTVILSFTHLLADPAQGELGEGQQRFVEVINRHVERMIRLIDDLTLLARIEAGQLPLVPQVGSPTALVEIAVADYGPVAEQAGVELRCAVQPGPAAEFDEARLHQVLANVLGNAIKFSAAGGVVTVRAGAEADGWWLTVADSGIGIPEAELDGILTPFTRGTNAARAGVPGSGLGLVVSEAILTMHGGTLELESKEGHGTTATIRLPLRFGGAP